MNTYNYYRSIVDTLFEKLDLVEIEKKYGKWGWQHSLDTRDTLADGTYISGSSYTLLDEAGKEINMGFSKSTIPRYGWFEINKQYYPNGYIKHKSMVKRRNRTPYGLECFFDSTGRLTKVIDHDAKYKMQLEAIVAYANAHKRQWGYADAETRFDVDPNKEPYFNFGRSDSAIVGNSWTFNLKKLLPKDDPDYNNEFLKLLIIIDDETNKIISRKEYRRPYTVWENGYKEMW